MPGGAAYRAHAALLDVHFEPALLGASAAGDAAGVRR
jgi:hypothetical protein